MRILLIDNHDSLRWHGGRLGFRPAQESGEIAVVDSWLVTNGRMRGFEAHERRFGTACGDRFGIGRSHIREFLLAAMARVPAEGRWFPRAELRVADGPPGLHFRIRPAPPQGHSVRLWLPDGPDARTCPAVKGPDLEWLAAQRAAAVKAGAGEAVLLSADGRVLEGSTTSILWWRGDTLCAPPEDGRILPGTTRAELFEAADASGVPVAFENPRPRDLDGLEVWAVNALHGIRPVTAWVGADISPGPANRALRWQVYLDQICWEVKPRQPG